MSLSDVVCSGGREESLLRRSAFLLHFYWNGCCGKVVSSGACAASLLALGAYILPEKRRDLWRRLRRAITCGFASSKSKRSGAEAASMLLRFNNARTSSVKLGFIQKHELVKPRTDLGGFASCFCTNALEAVSLLETGSDKHTATPCSMGRTCSDLSHRVRDKI
ncbi:hypothetical protein Bca52824_032963 [Brassica carinata]|uniref:Plant disease resistance WDH domain-containing protein n=1 Tax=Brassica carinata TaxID=52824 RepID=A0A8X7SDG0_BRACI|nr:hypothetical protein Bca52824_032963 [Brassica carinata]